MEGMTPNSDYTRELNQAVIEVKKDEKWRREFMVMNELLKEWERLSEWKVRIAQVRQSRKRFSIPELANIYYIDIKAVQAILEAIDAHPDWDDEQIAENIDLDWDWLFRRNLNYYLRSQIYFTSKAP